MIHSFKTEMQLLNSHGFSSYATDTKHKNTKLKDEMKSQFPHKLCIYYFTVVQPDDGLLGQNMLLK